LHCYFLSFFLFSTFIDCVRQATIAAKKALADGAKLIEIGLLLVYTQQHLIHHLFIYRLIARVSPFADAIAGGCFLFCQGNS
jgi:hypothetical protein